MYFVSGVRCDAILSGHLYARSVRILVLTVTTRAVSDSRISAYRSVIHFIIRSYQYSATTGFILASLWCLVICVSRIYLGMHSVAVSRNILFLFFKFHCYFNRFLFYFLQDVFAGILLTILLMIPLIPLADKLDHIILSTKYSPIFVIGISILLIIYYPRSDKWTPTRYVTSQLTFSQNYNTYRLFVDKFISEAIQR